MKPSKIEKALSQEAQTILSNIQSLAQELMTAEGQATTAEEGMTGSPVQQQPEQISTVGKEGEGEGGLEGKENEDEEGKEPKEPGEVEKDQTSTPSDVATARDEALDRMVDTISEVDEENVEEVKKAIRSLKKMTSVRKSSDAQIFTAIKELTKVVKGVIDNQTHLEKAVGLILEGSGITKQIEEAIKVEKAAPAGRPIIENDNGKMVEFLKTIQKSLTPDNDPHKQPASGMIGENTSKVRKNLETAVSSLIPRQ